MKHLDDAALVEPNQQLSWLFYVAQTVTVAPRTYDVMITRWNI